MADKTDKLILDAALVRQIADLMDEIGLSEIEIANGTRSVRVARERGGAGQAPAPADEAAEAPADDPAAHPGAVVSPMVGTVYLAPEPGEAPFVKVGDTVTEGQTLLIVEAMKTMNPVTAPRAGRVARVLTEDGAPVEYGEVLLILD